VSFATLDLVDSGMPSNNAQGPSNASSHQYGTDVSLVGGTFFQSPEPLAKILDLTEDAILSVDEDQLVVLFNHGAEKMFGYTAAEICGRSLDILYPNDS